MPGRQILRKWSDQDDWLVEVRVTASPQVLLSLGFITIEAGQPCQLEINLPKPGRMRSFIHVRNTPSQFIIGRFPLMKTVGKLGTNDAADPVHDEDLAAGKLFGALQHGNGLLHPGDSMQERNILGVLSS